MKVVCVKCEVELKPETNGVAVIELAGDDPYRLWRADLLKCPGCGVEIVSGFAPKHVAHYEPDFPRQLEKARTNTPRVIYDRERLKRKD